MSTRGVVPLRWAHSRSDGTRAPRLVRQQLCQGPPWAQHVLTWAGTWPAGPRGQEPCPGSLPARCQQLCPRGDLGTDKPVELYLLHLQQMPIWALISEIKADHFETSSKTGQSVGE